MFDGQGGMAAAAQIARECAALDRAVSADRLGPYVVEAAGDPDLARDLYLWDRDVAMALLADVAVIEVALRNAMASALSRAYGEEWYHNPDLEFDDRSLGQLHRAWSDLPPALRRRREEAGVAGMLRARCMFGFWANLLDAGGHVGCEPRRRRADYEELWRSSLHSAFRGGAAEGHEACRKLARMIDRDLASWLDRTTTVPAVLAARPRATGDVTAR